MKVLVCGGRDFDDMEQLENCLYDIHINEGPITLLIHGGASGADDMGGDWARQLQINCLCVPAKWGLHARAAGPIRNSEMLALNPDLVVAFPGGKGTADMVAKAKASNVKVIEVG